MTVFDFYRPGQTWLHQRDARVKIALTIAGLLLLFSTFSLPIQLAGLAVLLLWLRQSASGLARLRPYWIGLVPVAVLMLALRGVFVPVGPAAAQLGPIRLTWLGFAAGGVVAVRILSVALLILLLLSTTRLRDLAQALVQLRIPYAWALSLVLAIRFLPSLVSVFQTIRQSQIGRGLDLDHGPIWRRLPRYMPILIAMIVASLRRAEMLAIALEARGFRPQKRPTAVWPLVMQPVDWLLLGVGVMLFVAAIAGRTLLGFGADPLWPF